MGDRSDDKRDEAQLAADFLAWANGEDDGIPIDATQPWRDLRIEPEETTVLQLERVVEFRARALAGDDAFWLDAARSAHLCLTAGMVAALEGSSGVGAMTVKAAGATLAYLRHPDRAALPWPRERTMPFSDLVEAIQTPGRLEFGAKVTLTDEQKNHDEAAQLVARADRPPEIYSMVHTNQRLLRDHRPALRSHSLDYELCSTALRLRRRSTAGGVCSGEIR